MTQKISSSYSTPWLLRNPHLHTIIPNLFRKIKEVHWQRERIELADGDFLDLDRLQYKSATLLVLVHGLEGNSSKGYMKGMARAANKKGWVVAALNMRGCSLSENRLYSSYHSGKTDDLKLALEHLQKTATYTRIFLIGFSLGGNICLKFTGENGPNIAQNIKGVVGVSVPVDLAACAKQLSKPANILYLIRFLRSLKKKLRFKKKIFPELAPSAREISAVRSFADFDNLYTAPAHGFKDAQDYWEQCSSSTFLDEIQIPTLLVNALDDPFLPPSCYPFAAAEKNPYFQFETPAKGGHVGFIESFPLSQENWIERRALAFLEKL